MADKTYTMLELGDPAEPEEDDEDEEERKQILGDAPRLKPNPSVPQWKKCLLAVLRAVLFVAVCLSLLYLQIYLATEYQFSEKPLGALGELNSSTVVASLEENCIVDETVVDLWAKNLAEKRSLMVSIHPSEAHLPAMKWYSSEEVYRNRGGWVPLLSFGQRLTQPTAVNLTVKKDWEEAVYLKLLEDAFLRHHFMQEDGERFTGIYLEGPDGRVWHREKGWSLYEPSWDWKFLTTTAFLVLFVAFFSLMKCVVREAEVDWKEACEVWVTHYDYCWKHVKKYKGEHKKGDTKMVVPKKPKEKKRGWLSDPWSWATENQRQPKKPAKSSDEPEPAPTPPPAPIVEVDIPWEERLMLCSPFFVLDNSLSNAHACEEEASWAVISSLVHALTLSALPSVTCVACHFMPGWLSVLNTVMLAYAIAIIPLAMIYYFSLHHGRMNLTFALIQIFLMLCWTITGLLYLLSALIYIAAVAAVDPDLIVDALIPLATALAYVMVVFSRLKALQTHYMEAAAGKAPKGFLMWQTSRLGFSTAGIIMLCIEGVGFLFGIFFLQLAMRNLYAGQLLKKDDILQASILPTFALVNSVLNMRRNKMNEAGDYIQNDMVTAIKDIF